MGMPILTSTLPIIIGILAFLTVVLTVAALTGHPSYDPRVVRHRLDRYIALRTPRERREGHALITLRKALRNMGKFIEAQSYAARLEEELERANLPLRGSEFVVLNLLIMLGAGTLGLIFSGSISIAFIMTLVGALAPWAYLNALKGRRLAAFNAQIADALTAISNSLRAGYSFLQAMDGISKEMPPPLSEEFARTLKIVLIYPIHFSPIQYPASQGKRLSRPHRGSVSPQAPGAPLQGCDYGPQPAQWLRTAPGNTGASEPCRMS